MIFNKFISKYFIFYFSFFLIKCHSQNAFLFSVILSIYNTGKYLDHSISSLLNQTIGFEKNIQIILVNDGSSDNSEEICMKYIDIYSENIIYINKENGGLSSARNIGLDYVKGDFINFLDPDDMWSNNSFKYANNFFTLNPKIDFVGGRMKYFEASNEYHPLDYKFYNSRVIDMRKEYKSIHLSVASSFFRSSTINCKKFINGLISGEDTRFVNELLLNKPFMGVLKEAVYYYRKRTEGNSIVQTAKTSDIFYFITPNLVHNYLLNLSLRLFNIKIPFIQFYVAYDILFRLISSTYKYLNLPKLIKYSQIIIQILKRIDEKFILEQKNVGNNIKILALSKKYNEDMRKYIKGEKGKIKYNNYTLMEPEKYRFILVLKYVDIHDNTLYMEGSDNCWLQREKYYFFCQIGKTIFLPNYKEFNPINFKTMFGTFIKGRIINYHIPLDDKYLNQNIKFYFSYMNETFEIFPLFGYFCRVPPINNSYYVKENYIITYDNKRFSLIKNSEELREKLELKYVSELEKNNKKELIPIREDALKYMKNHDNKEIWLINDRPNKAGDNGESFFRFLKKKNPNNIIYYFVISDKCNDYERLKDLGNILILGSKEYNLTFLKADKLISSSSNAWVDNPFGDNRKYLIDLFLKMIFQIFLINLQKIIV